MVKPPASPAPPSVGIVGGGVAGLTLASLLAQRGAVVTVYERDRAGGKLRREQSAGLTFDTGPSLFTFPEVWRRVLARLGESDPLDLRPLPGGLGVHYTSHGPLPLPVPPEHPLYAEWQGYVRRVVPLRDDIVTLLSTPPSLGDPAFLGASRRLFSVLGPHLSAQGWLSAQGFSAPLHHALATHALNAGLPPQDAPALYALLPALIAGAVYRPAAGMGALLGALLAFAQARGVQVREQTAVLGVQSGRALLAGGETVRHDLLVSAADPQRLRVLRGLASPSPLARRSVSGLALYAPAPTGPVLAPTSIISPSDFGAFRRSMRRGALPADTLTLIHAGEGQMAVLLTVPALSRELGTDHPWVRAQLARAARLLGAEELLAAEGEHVALGPLHYAAGGHPGGAIYGAAFPPWRAGPLHPEPYRAAPGLWQVGTGVHPGGGLPAVLGGALIVDTLLARRGRSRW